MKKLKFTISESLFNSIKAAKITEICKPITQYWISRLILDQSVHNSYHQKSMHHYKNFEAIEFKCGNNIMRMNIEGFSVDKPYENCNMFTDGITDVCFVIHIGAEIMGEFGDNSTESQFIQ